MTVHLFQYQRWHVVVTANNNEITMKNNNNENHDLFLECKQHLTLDE